MNTPPNRADARSGQLRLGRYAGISVRAHWSLLVVLLVMTQILAVGVLPATLDGQHPAAYWLVGAAAALVFLAALLVHELAHAAPRRPRCPRHHDYPAGSRAVLVVRR